MNVNVIVLGSGSFVLRSLPTCILIVYLNVRRVLAVLESSVCVCVFVCAVSGENDNNSDNAYFHTKIDCD